MRNVHYGFSRDNTITGYVVSKGETFTAEAKLSPGDKYSEQIGKSIVKYRLEIKQRKRDLHNTEEVINRLQEIYAQENKTKNFSEVSKHWMRFIQDACEERKSQLDNIAFAKIMLELLTEGDVKVENIIRKIVRKHYSDERTIGLLISVFNVIRGNETEEDTKPTINDSKIRERVERLTNKNTQTTVTE